MQYANLMMMELGTLISINTKLSQTLVFRECRRWTPTDWNVQFVLMRKKIVLCLVDMFVVRAVLIDLNRVRFVTLISSED